MSVEEAKMKKKERAAYRAEIGFSGIANYLAKAIQEKMPEIEAELEAKLQEIKSIAEERPQAVLLWENTDIPESGSGGGQEALPASEDATFAAQRRELDLSKYSMVLIQFSTHSVEVFDSGKWVYEPAVIEKVCAVGSGKYSTVSNMSSAEGATRHFRVDKDGISFLSAKEFSYANPGVSDTNNSTLIPCKIFGL